ncbi:MAG: SAM-dependent methyltransferase [Betaproteobacteria bacterium]|nr:SAM-dependent methyltransferase [Betaproteobacteria bacterium]
MSSLPAHLSQLPAPSAEALAHSARLRELIAGEIASGGGWISFARYMELALHAPGLGYYSAGTTKFGAAGDFVTAPELGHVFGSTLARQAAQILRAGIPDIVELGAGSGKLARDLLAELAVLDSLPQRYLILETSADLRQRQQQLLQRDLPQLAARVTWLDALPAKLNALIIGNEVLDAMPVHIVSVRADGIDERGVILRGDGFAWGEQPATGALLDAAITHELAPGYCTEINLAAQSFIRTLASRLERGVVILIDYGFPAREYFHAQRSAGTLMCHYRQHAHDDPLSLVGLQDITAHVDFSAIAEAATQSGLELLGYASQAQFLINCGITDVLAATPAENTASYLPLAAQAQKLLSPAEMGELFKVIACGRNHPAPLAGFPRGNQRRLL